MPSRLSPTDSPALTEIAHIDFETRSKCDLVECGAAVYSEHPSTEALCMAYKFGKGETNLWTPMDGDCPERLVAHIRAGGLVEGYGEFEQHIWANVCVARMGWPSIEIDQWRDGMAVVAAMSLPQSLGEAAAALGAEVQKDTGGHAVMMKVSRPRKPSKNNPAEWHDDPALFERLYSYCRQDVDAEHSLLSMIAPLSANEVEVWKASNAINRRGIYCDRQAVDGALRMIGLATADYHRQVAEVTHGVLTGDNIGSWQQVLPWCAGRGVTLPNFQKLTIDEALKHRTDIPDDVRKVLTIRQALGRTSAAKYTKMVNMMCRDSRLRGQFSYHGAGPGRWAGRGVQLQNIVKGEFTPEQIDACFEDMRTLALEDFAFLWGDPMRAASWCIRGALCAPPGKILVCADLSTIEARVLNWLAGQNDILDMFRRGADVHSKMASVIFRIPVAEVDRKTQRPLGKVCELGCGFGMGGEKFQASCETGRISITPEQAQEAVDAYRESHPMVVRFWRDLDDAAIAAVRSGGVTAVSEKRIQFRMRGQHLLCRLPSGRVNTYPFARVDKRMVPWKNKDGSDVYRDAVTFMGVDGKTHQWVRQGAYGGLWAENVSQAIARDLLAAAMVRAEQRGHPIVTHAHDELVAEVTPGQITEKQLCALMCELPPWAEGLPVAAEGWEGSRYRK